MAGVKRKTAPYAGTQVPPEQTKGEIEKLLRAYGADAVQWSEIFSANKVQLQFVFTAGSGRKILVRLEPPSFSSKRRSWVPEKGRTMEIDAPNWAQSYRLLKAYLKAKLESIAYGLRDVEEEFLADMVVRNRAGDTGTVRQLLELQIGSGDIRPALGPGDTDPNTAGVRVLQVGPISVEFQGGGGY